MNDFLQNIISTTEQLQKFRDEHLESRREAIRSGKSVPLVRKDADGQTAAFTFGEFLHFHRYDARDDAGVRSNYGIAYRALMEDAISACKFSAAKYLVQEGIYKELTENEIRTDNDEQVLDAMVACVDSIVFGEKHGLLPSEEEFQKEFEDKKVPLTHGIFLEMSLYVTNDKDPEKPIDLWLIYSVGRFMRNPQDTEYLNRVILESSLPDH